MCTRCFMYTQFARNKRYWWPKHNLETLEDGPSCFLAQQKLFFSPRTWEEVPCKRFWVSTSATGNNEVSASAKPSCAHKSRHGLSASPLHLRDFGWYFRTLPRAYARTLRIEARRNWRLKSSCQEVSRRTLLLFLGRRESTVVWLSRFNWALPALTSALRAI